MEYQDRNNHYKDFTHLKILESQGKKHSSSKGQDNWGVFLTTSVKCLKLKKSLRNYKAKT